MRTLAFVRAELLAAVEYLQKHGAPYERVQGLRVAVMRLDAFEQIMRGFFRGEKEPIQYFKENEE